MKHFLAHVRKYFFRGLLAVIPVVFTALAIQFLYVMIDQKIVGMIFGAIGFRIPGLGILMLVITLYVLGVVASNVAGKQAFRLVEGVSARIPIIKTTYQVGKQLANALSFPERHVFKRVVLVDYLKPGMWTVGFVTGTIMDKQRNKTLLKVFVPTPPNPTSGTMVIVEESQTRDPGWSIDQALKAVISGGIIGPSEIGAG